MREKDSDRKTDRQTEGENGFATVREALFFLEFELNKQSSRKKKFPLKSIVVLSPPFHPLSQTRMYTHCLPPAHTH